MAKLYVGAGSAPINPEKELFPISNGHFDMGGGSREQEAVYDDCLCRAIAVDNGRRRILFVCYEIIDPPCIDDLEGILAEKTGFCREDIVLTATHNHSAPRDHGWFGWLPESEREKVYYRRIYEIELEAGIRAAQTAVSSMRPAKYGYGETKSYVNVNRDVQTPFGYWVEGKNLEGFSDKTLAIIKFVDEEERLIAALMNHATHATCIYMMKDADGREKTSGNFTGIASRFVEKHFGNGAVAMWTAGAAGDQNPLVSHGLQYEYPDGYSSAVEYPAGTGYQMMEYAGRMHGADCVRGIEEITDYSDNMPIFRVKRSAWLPAHRLADPERENPFRMGGNGLREEKEFPYGSVPPAPDPPKMADDPDHPVELKLQLILLGDIAIVGMNGEIYNQIGMEIKKASPYRKTFILTHTDKEKTGYILDKASRGKKVFQAYRRVKPGAADEVIVKNTLEMFKEVLDLPKIHPEQAYLHCEAEDWRRYAFTNIYS